MQKANKISLFFFLSLFSLIMLHQALPHLHHQHEDSHAQIAHSNNHQHHEEGSNETQDSGYDLFNFFVNIHVHSTSSIEVVVSEKNRIKQQNKSDKNFSHSQVTVQSLASEDNREIDNPPIYHPPHIYFNPYLSHLDLRGPPILG